MTATVQSTATRPYGLWDSPITPTLLSQGRRLSDVAWDTDGETLVWLEGRSDRGVLVCARLDDAAPRDLTSDLSVRAMVGYGGGDFTVGHGHVYFVSGGRIYRQPLDGGPATPITPAFGNAAAPALSPDGRWLVFVHSYEDADVLAIVDAEGSAWPLKLVSGHDFIMQPRWHPDGDRIAWVVWDHPRMPWDGTELWIGGLRFDRSMPEMDDAEKIAGDDQTAIFQPEFSPDGRSLAYISNANGWGHIYLHDLGSGEIRQLTHGNAEHGRPAWQQGIRSFAFIDGSRRLTGVRAEGGYDRVQVVNVESGVTEDAELDRRYAVVEQIAATTDGARVAAIASGPAQPARVIGLELAPSGTAITTGPAGATNYQISIGERVWARASGETIPPGAYSRPESIAWTSFDGEPAHGLYYPPANAGFRSLGLPPLVVLVHGGPTSQMTASYHAQTQFLTSRGYAVLEVNYRGSTGYGRDYMMKLRESWGIYDVEDSISGARSLAEQGRVDPVKRVIMGGSAGGFTVLQTLATYPGVFTAGICLYGVANHFTLAAETHKFEARYLDSMLGPLPEAAAVYRERSPIFHAAKISDPIAVFQGSIDTVVPKNQSETIVASLKARGVPHEYHVYEGEGHGWRRTDTIESFYDTLDAFLRQYVVYA
ncbi:MAG: prolyl oligopeptidase family serine peptidase [Dehalococcoidia bacterium]